MATAPANSSLPLFYKDLAPLNSQQHGGWNSKPLESAAFVEGQHAIPLTTDEFVLASRNFPVIFSAGDNPVPLALMGLNEGVNVFLTEGRFNAPVYIPAYIRRYPFMLARMQPDSDELTLCFDPSAGGIGEFEGEPLFADGQPTETTKSILKFCEDFEQAGARTYAFVEDLKRLDLLMDGEVSINQEGIEAPFIYRGFKMVNEEKLRDLRGDELRKLNQSGALPLIYAHLMSLPLMRDLFAAQASQGNAPKPATPVLEPAG